MIREIKRRPITYNGKDCFEVLVRNSDLEVFDTCYTPCFYCIYNNYDDEDICCIVHGCTSNPYAYFILVDELNCELNQ